MKLPPYSKINEGTQEPKNFKKWKTKTTKGLFMKINLQFKVATTFLTDTDKVSE
jgi:hypothetical protein